jgi:hypothetical protein
VIATHDAAFAQISKGKLDIPMTTAIFKGTQISFLVTEKNYLLAL